MIVQGGKTFLNNQGAAKKSRQSDSDNKSFKDLLVGANKKKKPSIKKSSRKALPKKPTSNNELADDQQHNMKREEVPVKKKITGSRVHNISDKRQQEPSQKIEKEAVAIKDSRMVKASLEKNGGQSGEVKLPVDSLNLSGTEGKTLEKNQKIMQAMENSFEEVMAQSKNGNEKIAINNSNGKTNLNLQGQLQAQGLQKSGTAGKIKIDPEMTLAKPGQTLAMGGEQASPLAKVLKSSSRDSASGDSSTNLDSLINQYIEQDGQSSSVEGHQFVDEMNLAQMDGKADKIENMQSIVKQARAFVDDGGGSMEIHLQPEGLGKVHLKVAVNDGQVNVEMMANNLNAKKALEDGLFDIKQALEGQKLLVETLKVEMSPDYQKDFSDLENHMQEQANRDFAEQFLGQFKQEREERLGGMFDAFKSFQRGPQESELTLNRNPYAESGKGRSINLVA